MLCVASAAFPAARAGELSPAAFERTVDGLLQVTRWTGLALPLSGGYRLRVLYPVDRLLGTTSGHLVLAMLALWGLCTVRWRPASTGCEPPVASPSGRART